MNESDFFALEYSPDARMLTMNYKVESIHMVEDDFRAYILSLKAFSIAHTPDFILDDSRNRGFILTPEIQEWTVAELAPAWMEFGLKKYAQVLADDIFANISGQQVVEEARKIPGMFETKFFDKPKDALVWFEIEIAP